MAYLVKLDFEVIGHEELLSEVILFGRHVADRVRVLNFSGSDHICTNKQQLPRSEILSASQLLNNILKIHVDEVIAHEFRV